MILALNAAKSVSWKQMEAKVSIQLCISVDILLTTHASQAKQLAHHLDKPVGELREKLAVAPSSPIANPQRTR